MKCLVGMLVSVIVPVYQAEKTLSRCVKSIQRQSYQNMEILLVENGSTDKSFLVGIALAEQDDRITVVHIDSANVSQARNWGLEHAQGEYLCFVDSDDYLDSEFVEVLVKGMWRENATLSSVNYWINDAPRIALPLAKSMTEWMAFTRAQAQAFLFQEDGYKGFVWNKLFLASVVQEGIPLRFQAEISYCEDMLFVFDYLQRAGTVYYTSKPLYHYSVYPESTVFSSRLENWVSALDAYSQMLEVLRQSHTTVYQYALVGRAEICRGLMVELMRFDQYDKVLWKSVRQQLLQGVIPVFTLKKGVSLRTKLLMLLACGTPHFYCRIMKIRKGRRAKKYCQFDAF